MTLLGIVAALPAEATALSGRRQRPGTILAVSASVLLHQCGIGRERAAVAARALLDRGAVALVSWGLAGALGPECRAGDLLLPRHVVFPNGERAAVDEEWRERLLSRVHASVRVHEGDQLVSDSVVRDATAKSARLATGAAGVDMESGAVAAVAAAAGVPFLVARCVSDAADVGIPACATAGTRADGTIDLRAVLTGVMRRPRELVGLLRLWRSSAAAVRALRTVARLTRCELAFASKDDSGRP